MTKEQFSKSIKVLQNISIDFKIDYYFFSAKSYIRGIIISNPEDMGKVENILEPDVLKNFRVKKSKSWYLGKQKEVIYMKLKNELEMDISEIEELQVNNYP